MKPLLHISAKPSHYNKEAESYDAFKDTCGIDGSKFVETKTERILMIAKKQK